jgi:excinuclease ABC subunit A
MGEIQRLKLAKYLVLDSNNKSLFLLDEPSKGLSNIDIDKLFTIFNELEAKNHSIIMVEHNTKVLKQCDYLIELGPDAAEKGGEIIGEGSVEMIVTNRNSVIGQYL